MAALWILPVGMLFLLKGPGLADLLYLVVGVVVPAILMGWLHVSSYGRLQPPYFDPGRVFHFACSIDALAVNMLSAPSGPLWGLPPLIYRSILSIVYPESGLLVRS